MIDYYHLRFIIDNSESFFRMLFTDIEREIFVHDLKLSSGFKRNK